MSEAYKICPICNTANHSNATVCTTCGTDLSHVETITRKQTSPNKDVDYDFRYGETDLLEASLSQRANMYLVIVVTIILTLIFVFIGLALTTDLFATTSLTEVPADDLTTPSPRPTIDAATVTLGPPTSTYTYTPAPTDTPSITPTRGPCAITLPQGQTLIWALGQCGHRSMDVMPTVLALNNLSDASSVQSNQEILIPWPTSTVDPNALPSDTATIEGDAFVGDTELVALDESIEAFQATVTPTLPPGVMWHQVQEGQNIIEVALIYNTDVQTLSQLNRQIDFARCDFGETFGGQDCIVALFPGQQLRVPAPTPTPTLSPTPDPNATATPTATATENIPSAISPSNQQFFYRDELITLRWVPTATLRDGERYRIDVMDLTSGEHYVAYTTDIFFTVPPEWQGTQDRHEFEWTVGIVSQDNTDRVRNQTIPLIFVWQGIRETESD